MWRVIWFFLGLCRLRVHGADPERVLTRLARQRVAFHGCRKQDAFSLSLWVLRRDAARAAELARQGGFACETVEQGGFPTIVAPLRRRPVLLVLLALAVASAVVVPKFVFFYEVEGNETVPSEQILRELQALGVGFGTYGPSIKPQALKNQMLLRIPKLQWLTVQQSGMRARVVVRERLETEPVLDRQTPTNVVAARTGIITRVQAEAGNCLCAPGQAVVRGQLLVSAYTDFGFKIQASAARAEVYARTLRKSVCVMPEARTVKRARGGKRYGLSLLIGRRRVTLLPVREGQAACEKEEKTKYLTLPGGFSLPLGIAITTICEYDTEEEAVRSEDAEQALLAEIEQQARREMIAGTIQSSRCQTGTVNGCIRLEAVLQCEEMIARMQPANVKETIP